MIPSPFLPKAIPEVVYTDSNMYLREIQTHMHTIKILAAILLVLALGLHNMLELVAAN